VLVRFFSFAALLALVVVVAGCGGGGSSTGGSTDAQSGGGELTKADFISQADEVCSAYDDEVEPIKKEIETIEESGDSEDPAEVKKLGGLLKETVVAAEGELKEIQALQPPKSDEAKVDSILAGAEDGNGIGLEAASALEENDIETFTELIPKAESTNLKARKGAEAYGLKVCGQEP
jgi:rubrerythrin